MVIEALVADQRAAIAERDDADAEFQRAQDAYMEVIRRRGTPVSATDTDGWSRYMAHGDEARKSLAVVDSAGRDRAFNTGMARGKFHQAQRSLYHIEDALRKEGLTISQALRDALGEKF